MDGQFGAHEGVPWLGRWCCEDKVLQLGFRGRGFRVKGFRGLGFRADKVLVWEFGKVGAAGLCGTFGKP